MRETTGVIICGQCRQRMALCDDLWYHLDGTPQCPVGLAEAFNNLGRMLSRVPWGRR